MTQKMKIPGIKKWFKRTSNQEWVENVNCKNCETQFSGKFCPECGQSVRDYDKPFSFIFYNFIGDFFAFDIRFFRTFVALLFKPGFLTKEYFAGRRVKYAPPFRLFIFVSFILFLLLQIYTNRGLTTVLDSNLQDGIVSLDSNSVVAADSVFNEVISEMDSEEIAATDSILNKVGIDIDSAKDTTLNFKVNMETFQDTRNLRNALNNYADVLEERLENEEDPEERTKLREYIRLCRSPEQATARILEYMSWAFFILLPIFALILKLAYIRRKQNYMRHLIFSIHIHSFIFLIMILIAVLYMIINGNLEFVTGLLMLSIPVYFVVALKKFYGQRTRKVILKFILISFIYNIIFGFTAGIVFLNALSII